MNTEKLSLSYDECEEGKTFEEVLNEFYENENSKEVEYLVIGEWGESYETSSETIVENLVNNKEKLLNLKGIFMGDMDSEECEISWINQSDLSPLIEAFPKLEELRIKGSTELRLSKLESKTLKSLIIECGGLGKDVIKDICNAKLPNLEHLEIYLGVEDYGFNGSIEDVKPLMEKGLFPKLKYLGLKDSEIQDEIAENIANASILEQLDTLDLSLGTLTDIGGMALFSSEKIKKLSFLDLKYHYLSDEMMVKLEGIGIKVDLSDQQEADEDDDYRYPSVTE